MSIWQDSNGKLHDDMNGAALVLPIWPAGMTQLTDAQAQALQNPAPTATELAATARATRDSYLVELDKVILRNNRELALGVTAKFTSAQMLQILQLAQDLANVPEQSGFPETIVWPTQPSWLTETTT